MTKNVAIVIGHTPDSQGACSPHGIPCEWVYNREIARRLLDIADVYEHGTYAKGYTSMVKETASRLNQCNFKLILCLHYNAAGPTATGCETLYYHKSTQGAAYAKVVNDLICSNMNQRNRGIKPLSNNDRGFGEVFYPKAPAIILEPFFGSNIGDVSKFSGEQNMQKYVDTLRKFIATV